MWHGLCQNRFGQAGPVLDKRCCHCVHQPVLQDPNATNATGGPPPPARQGCMQIDLKWNPFQQILQGGHKGDALLNRLQDMMYYRCFSKLSPRLPSRDFFVFDPFPYISTSSFPYHSIMLPSLDIKKDGGKEGQGSNNLFDSID